MAEIIDKYNQPDFQKFLSTPVTEEETCLDEVGCYCKYKHGSIYWHPNTGAHVVWGSILDKWESYGAERSPLGYPLTDETATLDGLGRFNHFQGGSIYHTPKTGAHVVWRSIRAKWFAMGAERSPLGYPLTDETATSDGLGRFNHFQGGSIYWSPKTGAHLVWGSIRAKWFAMGAERSPLGYPLTDETATSDGLGRFNHFQGGSIYHTPETGAHEIHGDILNHWATLGWEKSYMGYPITDELTPPSELRCQKFQNGTIVHTPQGGTREFLGAATCYLIGINAFSIGCTRAQNEDTVHIKLTVVVDGILFQDIPVMHVGNVRGGDHLVDLYYMPPIKLSKQDSIVTFSYIIDNIGTDDYIAIENGMKAAADAGLTVWLGPEGAGIIKITEKIYNFFNAKCDGPVAVDQISASSHLLKSWTAGSRVHSETRFYTGKSQYFCGPDYKYWVTWSIIRL